MIITCLFCYLVGLASIHPSRSVSVYSSEHRALIVHGTTVPLMVSSSVSTALIDVQVPRNCSMMVWVAFLSPPPPQGCELGKIHSFGFGFLQDSLNSLRSTRPDM